jgi:acetoacetyl-CoA synthetase
VTETIAEIVDCICVGQRRNEDADERVLLFVMLRPGLDISEQLIQTIKRKISHECSPRHVPKYIFQVADIPYTVNGKKCEINVKKIVSRLNVTVGGTVANPESLKLYEVYTSLPPETSGVIGKPKL